MFNENLKQLNKYDRIYIIDCLNKTSKKFILKKNLENKLIVFRQLSLNNADINYLNKNKINYTIFSWQNFNKNIYLMWLSHKISFKESDNIYNYFFKKNSIYINFLSKLYSDQKIKDAFKKYLIDLSQDYYDLKIIIKVLLKYNKNLSCYIFKESNCLFKEFDSNNSKINNLIFPIKKKSFLFKKCLILILYPLYTSFFCNKFKFNIKKKRYKVAFRVYSNGFAFDKNGSLDWIIEDDKKLINQSLFVLEDNLKKNNYDKFKGLKNTNYDFVIQTFD